MRSAVSRDGKLAAERARVSIEPGFFLALLLTFCQIRGIISGILNVVGIREE